MFFTVVMLLIMVIVVNAQDAQNPWHLIALENEREVAFYNVEVITGIETTAQSVKIILDNGEEFIHPLTTTKFGFEPRKEGSATTNESITASQWNVCYTNGRLHFSETVNHIAVYTVSGALFALSTGNHTEISVDLPSGIYIVQAGGKSTKLAVGANGNGGMVAQPNVETQASTYSSAPISLRSGNGINVYWNITASNSTMSVEIPNVQKFYFTADNSIAFLLKNGNTIELADYKEIDFSIEPVPISANDWDLERTFAIGGGVYHAEIDDINDKFVYCEYISVISKTDIIIYDVSTQKETKYSRSKISNNKFGENDYLITFTLRESDEWYQSFPLLSKIEPTEYGDRTMLYFLTSDYTYGSVAIHVYDFNGGTDKIPTVFEIDKDGNLVATYTNADGVTRQHTFRR
jgi:hypothetical protein